VDPGELSIFFASIGTALEHLSLIKDWLGEVWPMSSSYGFELEHTLAEMKQLLDVGAVALQVLGGRVSIADRFPNSSSPIGDVDTLTFRQLWFLHRLHRQSCEECSAIDQALRGNEPVWERRSMICTSRRKDGGPCGAASMRTIERGVCAAHATPEERVLHEERKAEWTAWHLRHAEEFSEAKYLAVTDAIQAVRGYGI
jgi:hypothetical protein